MRLLPLLIVSLGCLCMSVGFDMIVGDTKHRKMVYHERVKTFAIPFKKRIKTMNYTDPEFRLIKGILVMDTDFSHAKAEILDGGVGHYFATIRMKSQRSHPLNYEIEVYV